MGAQAIGNTPLTAARPPLSSDPQDFVAEHGDTLGSVAQRLGVDEEDLRKANPQALNPEGLYPGQRLTIPGSPQSDASKSGRDGAAAAVDAAAPGRPNVSTTFNDGAASVTQKTSASDPVEGRRAEATLSGIADKNGVKASAQFQAPADSQAADGSKVSGESKTTFGTGFDNKGVGADVTADRKTTSTQPDGSSSGSSSSTAGGLKVGSDGVELSGSRKNGTQVKGADGTSTSGEAENKGGVTFSTDSVGGSVERKTTGTVTDANGSSTGLTRKQNGSATFGANDFNIQLGTSIGVDKKNLFGLPVGISATVGLGGQAQGRSVSKDGTTTTSVSAEGSLNGKLGASVGKGKKLGSAEVSGQLGIKASAEIKVPDVEVKGRNVSPFTMNPLDPASMPKGSRFTLETGSFGKANVEAGFGVVKAQGRVAEETGTSLLAEKIDDDKVRLTSGPTAALSEYAGLGVDLGVASAMLGKAGKFSDAMLKSAEFDLSTPQGSAGYREALLAGRFPTENGTGVADVKTVQKLDADLRARLDGKLASFDFSVKGTGSAASDVITTRPGNLMTRETTLQFDDNVSLVMTRKYDSNQKELIDERRYSYKVDVDGKSDWLVSSHFMKLASPAPGAGAAAKSAELTYTEADMRALKDGAEYAASKDLAGDAEVRKLSGDSVNGSFAGMKPQDFAVALVQGMGSTNGADGGFVQHLKNIFADSKVVRGADGQLQLLDDAKAPLPGTLQIR